MRSGCSSAVDSRDGGILFGPAVLNRYFVYEGTASLCYVGVMVLYGMAALRVRMHEILFFSVLWISVLHLISPGLILLSQWLGNESLAWMPGGSIRREILVLAALLRLAAAISCVLAQENGER
mgnify:CR=1 FL=1